MPSPRLRISTGSLYLVAALMSVNLQLQAQPAASMDFERECAQRLPATAVRVKFVPTALEYNVTTSASELQALAAETLTLTEKTATLGLTQANLTIRARWQSQTLTQGKASDARACFRPNLTVDIVLPKHTIYIAREFPRGTCAFDFVLEHELRHAQVNERYAQATANALQGALTRAFGQQIFYGPPDQVQADMSANLNQQWIPWAKTYFNQANREHNKIDSPQEYARSQHACDGQIQALLVQSHLAQNSRRINALIKSHR